MADIKNKVPENAEGPFFVDDSCIDCDTCRCISPANFRRSDDHGYSYVYHQPATREERELAEEAIDCCPVGAIGQSDEASPVPVGATSGSENIHARIAGGEDVPAKQPPGELKSL
jgi:ferredoxin